MRPRLVPLALCALIACAAGQSRADEPAANVPVPSAPSAPANVPVPSAPSAPANVPVPPAPSGPANVPVPSAPSAPANVPVPSAAPGSAPGTPALAPGEPPLAGPSVRLALPAWMPDVRVEPGLDLIAAYAFRGTVSKTGPFQWFHSFEVPRAIGIVRVAAGPAVAALGVEGVYSSSEGALVGVAGDSFVVRIREARVGYRLSDWLAVDAGIVPTLVIPVIDAAFGLRALGAAAIEQRGIATPADLGLSARVTFPRGYGSVAVSAYNGEGYTNRELNRGKNIELAALFHPAPGGSFAPLGLFAAYQNGSSGTGLSRADRVTAALLWEGDRLRGGAAFTYAFGVADEGRREAAVVEASLRGEPVPRLILAARFSAYLRDVLAGDDHVLSVTGALGFRIAPPFEVFLALGRSMPGPVALASQPGSDFWEGRTAARFAF